MENNQFEEALKLSLEKGDPDITARVFTDTLEKLKNKGLTEIDNFFKVVYK